MSSSVSSKDASNKQLQEADTNLTQSLQDLEHALKELTQKYEQPNFWKMFRMYLLRGIAYGLGIIVSFAIIIPLVIALMKQAEWIPLVGSFISQLIEWVEGSKQFSP